MNKSDRERQILYGLTCTWNLEQNKKTKLIDTEDKLGIARGGEWVGSKMGEGNRKVQISSYKIKMSCECYVQHDGNS